LRRNFRTAPVFKDSSGASCRSITSQCSRRLQTLNAEALECHTAAIEHRSKWGDWIPWNGIISRCRLPATTPGFHL